MSTLRLGVHQLSSAEAGLVRALVLLLSQSVQDFCWTFSHEGPYDALLVDAGSPDLHRPELKQAARLVAALGADAPPAAGIEHLARPLHLEHLGAWLARIQPGLLARPAATAKPPAEPPAKPPAGAPAGKARIRLKRWPPHALLRADPRRVRMAAMLARGGLRLSELADLSGAGEEECQRFLQLLQSFGLLELNAPAHTAPIHPPGAPRSAAAPDADPMHEHHLLFTGPAGAGKSTAIAVLSGEPGAAGQDSGWLTLEGGERVQLVGTPGQRGFDFAWQALAQRALGLVILLDHTRPDPLADLGLFVEGFFDELSRLPCVVGVGRTEECTSAALDEYGALLAEQGLATPVLAVDVRQREDALLLLDTLLVQLEAQPAAVGAA